MVQNLKFKIFIILAILILAVLSMYTKEMTLGLDLSGGSSLRYKLPKPEDLGDRSMQEILDDTLEVFRKRIQGYGLKEIPIRGQDDDEITIELPGMSQAQVDNIIDIIQSQGQLEWVLVAEDENDEEDNTIAINVSDERVKLVEFLQKLEEEEGGWDLQVDLSPLNFELDINGRKAFYRWLPAALDSLERTGIPIPEKGSTLDSLLPEIEDKPELVERYFQLMKKFADREWQFMGQDLQSVYPSFDQMRNPAVGFQFQPERENAFADFTNIHTNKRMAIVLDGEITSAPNIEGEISGPGIISGPQPTGFTRMEQQGLLTVLRSGSLDVKPVLLSQNTIGPTLGENSINRGKSAIFVGLSAVFVFLIIYYLFAGVVASIALAINLALLVGIMMFLEATLTLPGIAGIVLTLGMAVDANILIFERIREEKDKGKTLAQSVKNGFERAFITIVDANATTFITGFILYKFGTGPLKGFAATLMIGICTSLFAALLVSKVIFATMIENNWLKKLNMLRFLKSPKINFLTAMPPAGMISLLVILGGLVCFFIADESKYGLDFTGGYNVQLKCEEGTTQADVQTKLGAVYPNVQVVSIKQGLTGTLREPYEHFDVKIKSTSASDQSPDPEDTEDYLTRIKELLAEHIISDPITEIDIRPDEARGIAEVRFVLNLAEPTDQETVSQALGEVLRIENIQPLDEDSFQINAVYTRGTTLTELELQGFVSVQVEQAAMTEGVGIALLDPFPMTGFIGPTVGSELRDKAVIAILLSLLAIIIYIRIRFKEYKYGFAAASALVHDVLITLGAVAVARLTGIVDVEIGLPLIAAFLTIIGYSLNDTIVVFDRVRENLPRMNLPFRDLVNTSINQTLARTILTSLTTLTVVIILFAINYGQRNVLEGFSFALIVGVIVGTYSSIFVASPVLLAIHKIGEVEAKGAQPSDRGKEGRGKKKKSGKASKTAK